MGIGLATAQKFVAEGVGSFVFHLLSGKGAFACQTLPWATRGEQGVLDRQLTMMAGLPSERQL